MFWTLAILSTVLWSQTLASQISLTLSRGNSHHLRLLTYNVRYDSIPDNTTVAQTIQALPKRAVALEKFYTNTTEQPWSIRRMYVVNDIFLIHASIVSGQELLKRQVEDLHTLLGHSWSWVGCGRDDGVSAGEYSPIFYMNENFKVIESDTFWLSDTPFRPSKYPGAGSIRICTVVRFESINPPTKQFTVLNTHLDDQSSSQRELGMSLILHRARYQAIKTRQPVILTGDFNSPPNDSAYKIITGAQRPVAKLNIDFLEKYSWSSDEEKGFEDFAMLDLLDVVEARYRSGSNYATFTDFVPVGDTTQFQRLDYVMVGNTNGWNVTSYFVGDNIADDGIYHSDHRPVSADIILH